MRYFFLLVFISTTALAGCSPLRDSEEQITERLLERTPLQTSKSLVRTKLAEMGFSVIEQQGPSSVPMKEPFQTKEWNSLFRADLGEYGFPLFNLLRTDVVAFFVFNEDDRLVEISVVKYHEGF